MVGWSTRYPRYLAAFRPTICRFVPGLLFLWSINAQPESFTQTVVTSPAPPVPGLITVAIQDGGETQAVRMLFVWDGELLLIPLSRDSETNTFRGLFPTPLGIGSYQLQLVRRSGGVSLSKRYLLPPVCQEQKSELSPSAMKIYEVEQEIVRTRFLLSTLKRLEAK